MHKNESIRQTKEDDDPDYLGQLRQVIFHIIRNAGRFVPPVSGHVPQEPDTGQEPEAVAAATPPAGGQSASSCPNPQVQVGNRPFFIFLIFTSFFFYSSLFLYITVPSMRSPSHR